MHYDPVISERVLALLRQWGWETALQRLRAEAAQTSDAQQQTALQFFLGWMAAERGNHDEAVAQFQLLEAAPGFGGWAALAEAFVAHRRHDPAGAHALLDRASAQCDPNDVSLRATIALTRGTVFFHEGKPDVALALLHEALALFGRDRFGTGRVLDALGMVYAARDNFHAACEFYTQALACKARFQDDAGLALSHGQLGRLYLDWNQLDRAKEHFNEDRAIARRINDHRGEAQMDNHLGQVALARDDAETAAAYLDQSIRRSHEGGWEALEGYARKDRALAYLLEGEPAVAAEQATQAEALFRQAGFAEGLAHVSRAWGLILRAQQRPEESEQALRRALQHFETQHERPEVARTRLEVARTLSAARQPRPVIRDALLAALESAEACRRAALVTVIETELRAADEVADRRHVHRRVHGRDLREASTSLAGGARETITVLFLDLKGSTEYARGTDSEVVMQMLNQLMADLATALRPYEVQINQYLGDGFMALARGADHPWRAVAAAIDLGTALAEFNRPRQVLGLRTFETRVGVSTGEVFLGNVGTYGKMNYTAIGATVNLAARLQSEAEPGWPCISRETYERVKERFMFRDGKPRTVKPKGIGECEVWDVAGRKT